MANDAQRTFAYFLMKLAIDDSRDLPRYTQQPGLLTHSSIHAKQRIPMPSGRSIQG